MRLVRNLMLLMRCLLFRFAGPPPLGFRGSEPGIPVGFTSPGAGIAAVPHPDLDRGACLEGGVSAQATSRRTSNCFHLLRSTKRTQH